MAYVTYGLSVVLHCMLPVILVIPKATKEEGDHEVSCHNAIPSDILQHSECLPRGVGSFRIHLIHGLPSAGSCLCEENSPAPCCPL